MVQGGVDGVEMTHFLHPHDQEGRAKITSETSNIAERVWHYLGRRRVQIYVFVTYPTGSVNTLNLNTVTGHHHINKANKTICVFGRDEER